MQAPTTLCTPLEHLPSNNEISIHYAHTYNIWNLQLTLLDENFLFMVAKSFFCASPNLILVLEAQNTPEWPKWHKAIDFELKSL